jgi:hypothetical protein
MAQNQFSGGIAVYHDTTSGNNSVPGVVGFTSGVGYDQATGWGSVDASNLVNFWNNNATPDFNLAATPASQSVNQGSTATYAVTETALGGYSGTVTLSVSGLPTGATATFTPASLTGSGTSSLAISTALSTPTGSYPLTITGTDGVLTHTASITLVVTTPDFSLIATPALQTIVAGDTANYTATVGALNGYTGTVSFSVSGLPAGASSVFTPASITGSGNSALAIATTLGTTPNGSYPLVIVATDGVLTHSANITLVVTDFGISASPSSQTVVQGNAASYTVALTVSSGFVGNVNFSVSGLPVSSSAAFNPASLSASGTTTLTISTSTSTPFGTYPLTITASDGLDTRTASVTLLVDPIGDFGLTISPSSQTVNQGQNIGYGVTVSSSGGFTALVSLSVSGIPPGATATLSPNSVQGSGLVSLAIVPGANTPGGNYTITVTGSTGPLVHTATAALTILVPDFTFSASPASRTILVGQSTSYTATFTPINSYAGTVSFSVSGLPAGAVPTFTPGSLSSAGTTSLSITTNNTTPPGVYPLTITASDGTLSHSASVSLEVDAVPAADFTISAPPTITVKRNSTGSETVTISAVNGFTGVVNLSASNLPSLVTASFAPTSVTNSGTSRLTFTVDHRATQGVYNVTVTGTSGLLVHSTTVTLTVN